ncbi:hypothetical protein AXK58_14235 [Tsukamurella tyrosinosolvens]|nr:hypothetical protein AXK58_14235 [Tsukamurella tyrosinosolvens]
MFVMRGAPGAGKTHYLQANGFSPYAVGFDQARELLSGPHQTLDDGVLGTSRAISDNAEKRAVEFITAAVRNRCSLGETVFIDATTSTGGQLKRWLRLADEYDYELIVVDLQGDLDDDELLARNARRPEIDRVSPDVVVKIANRVRSSRSNESAGVRAIAPESVPTELVVPTLDFRGFDRVLVIGDVQGCGTVLGTLIEQVDPGERDAVVFVGDLFDRGVENALVYRTVQRLEERTNVRKISGNHCRHLIECIKHTAPGRYGQTRESIRQMVEDGILAGDLLALYRSMVPFITARFADDAELWISHGGVVGLDAYRVEPSPDLPMGGYRAGLISDRFFEYGASARNQVYNAAGDYSTNIDDVFADRYAGEGLLAFHGHRATPAGAGAGISFGLESSVEFDGGVLSAALVTRGSDGTAVEVIELPNPVTCGPKQERRSEQRKRAKTTNRELLEQLRGSDLVKEKVIEEGLSSFNFTRDAFYQQEWNELTTKARGLFLNTEDGAVVGRGYAKFFNVGERPDTALDAVLARFGDGGDVAIEHKLNGFLGLTFVHDGTLRAYSKSGPSLFADEFECLLTAHLEDRLVEFTEALGKARVTLTFEALSPRDPHIVDDGTGVVLLHAIARTVDRTLLLDDVADRFAGQFGFRRPETRVVSGRDAVAAAIEAASNATTEGIVLRHLPTGEMVKVKAQSYAAWKAVRPKLTQLAVGKRDIAEVRGSRAPRFVAATAVFDEARRQGVQLADLMVEAVHSATLDMPRLRTLVGDLPEVLSLSPVTEDETA